MTPNSWLVVAGPAVADGVPIHFFPVNWQLLWGLAGAGVF
jgi:hypothetical protein